MCHMCVLWLSTANSLSLIDKAAPLGQPPGLQTDHIISLQMFVTSCSRTMCITLSAPQDALTAGMVPQAVGRRYACWVCHTPAMQ